MSRHFLIGLGGGLTRDASRQSTVNSYWRVLKSLFVDKHGFSIDEGMREDCVNVHVNSFDQAVGLRLLPKRKPSGTKGDLYPILHDHWTRCTKAYAGEKQRLYVAAGIPSFISGARLVSLFDTRVKKVDEEAKGKPTVVVVVCRSSKSIAGSQNRHSKETNSPDLQPKVGFWIRYRDGGSKAPRKRKREPSTSNERSHDSKAQQSHQFPQTTPYKEIISDTEYEESERHPSGDTNPDLEYIDEGSDSDERESIVSNEPEGDNDIELSMGSVEGGNGSDIVAGNDFDEVDRFVEDVTDDDPVAGRPNILLAKATVLHTKSEDKKPRVLEDIYWQPIPSHLQGMNLKIKIKKLDQPVFRQPERTAEGYQTSETKPLKASTWQGYRRHVGLLSGLEYALTQYVWRRSLISAIISMWLVPLKL
ncbi:uncharacterized protein BDCG_09244 [Blastomyces dermatitidis ER-3]|uniref:Uncharacterized protein n=1 Tax=Ajellomyces dermatitidis (strain ER-3 / ATCC MYA-2586) TaxID=559297 RepID=A0ABP2EQS2_AJEDR|nr:uncharacterized protein BDCG_09244 [Blastomyces dermatitidis ER-3]EEQ85975.2 hypothetical protein BDCG_09244 [Blastomyces dermatitidis ER-3]